MRQSKIDSNKVIRHSSHKKEKKSKLEFEAIINPWIIFSWAEQDYGIDAIVDITHPIGNTKHDEVTGRKVAVQLKATTKEFKSNKCSVSVPTSKIWNWYNSNVPVLFVIHDQTDSNFCYVWIDDELINYFDKKSPKWRTQSNKSISIPKQNCLNSDSLDEIERYVIESRKKDKQHIAPGTYFEIKDEILNINYSLKEIAEKFQFESVNMALANTKQAIEEAIYRVTITGLSKVGKSTFINGLLRLPDISPTDMIPITGVPLIFLPGTKNYVEVLFDNGKKEIGEVTRDYIKQFVSLSENKRNEKGVKLVTVYLVNSLLEKGVAFFDVPGSDDLNEQVQEFNYNTIDTSNAVIYLIDVGGFQTGGSVFTSYIKKDLEKHSNNLDKVFLIFNKVDALSPDRRTRLEEYVKETLEEYGMEKIVHSKIFYISAEQSFLSRTNKNQKAEDTIEPIEKELWDFLLNENKVGVYKIFKIENDLFTSINNLESLIDLVLSDIDKKEELEAEIQVVENSLPDMANDLDNEKYNLLLPISQYIQRRNTEVTDMLERELKNIPVKESLPGVFWIRNYLKNEMNITISKSNNFFTQRMIVKKNEVDQWVEDNLDIIRSKVNEGSGSYQVDLSNLNNFVVANMDNLEISVGILNTALVLGLSIEFPPVGIVLGILSLLGWISSAENRRNKRINKIMGVVRREYQKASDELNVGYSKGITNNLNSLKNYANDRVNIFITDIKKEIDRMTNSNISVEERNSLKQSKLDISKIKKRLGKVSNKLKANYQNH